MTDAAEKNEILPPVELSSSLTKRPVSGGAERWLGVPIKCLDHGFVYLADYAGNDQSIEQAARVSYGEGTRKSSETVGLIRYLRRHDHTTPFEMVDLKFHARMPIFVARQWVRHRTASINEYSARYSIVREEFYVPEAGVLAQQSKSNRQGREEPLTAVQAEKVREHLRMAAEGEYDVYRGLLNDDGSGLPVNPDEPMVARELARAPLGTFFYTEWYWKVNLHNFMHFARLRMDPHAQLEIRVYAEAMGRIVKDAFPIAWKAFEDYELAAKKFSAPELQVLTKLLGGKRVRFSNEEIDAAAAAAGLTNRRERSEMVDKFGQLGFLEKGSSGSG